MWRWEKQNDGMLWAMLVFFSDDFLKSWKFFCFPTDDNAHGVNLSWRPARLFLEDRMPLLQTRGWSAMATAARAGSLSFAPCRHWDEGGSGAAKRGDGGIDAKLTVKQEWGGRIMAWWVLFEASSKVASLSKTQWLFIGWKEISFLGDALGPSHSQSTIESLIHPK